MLLTNQRQFSMVYTLIDHKMTAENVQNSSAKFWTFYGVILWSIADLKRFLFIFCYGYCNMYLTVFFFFAESKKRDQISIHIRWYNNPYLNSIIKAVLVSILVYFSCNTQSQCCYLYIW